MLSDFPGGGRGGPVSDDRFQIDPYDTSLPDIIRKTPVLPPWIARRLLRAGEQLIWVRGPRLNPWWERHATNPAWALCILAFTVVCVTVTPLTFLPCWGFGFVLFVGTVFVSALSAAYFTRLVVTDQRVVILQGHELCREWGINELPPSLVRFGPRGRAGGGHVDLDALQTLLGSGTEQFTDSKTIQALGKHLDRIKARKDGR
jgi:hypothetical protein